MTNRLSITLIHNAISPYRNSLFEQLNKSFDLNVYFCIDKEGNRLWETSIDKYTFDSRILKSIRLGPFVLNYLLPIQLLTSDQDAYVVVDTMSTIITTFLTLLIAKVQKKPFILWSGAMKTPHSYERLPELIHNSSVHPLIKQVAIKSLEHFESGYRRLLYQQADAFVAYSNKAKEYLIERGVDSDDIFVGGQVMPEDQLSSPPSTNHLEHQYGEKMVILSLGYLRDVKGLEFLIKAVSKIDKENIRLIIAGDGKKRKKLEKLASGDDRITFAGYVEGSTKAAYYSMSDVFILPTLHDPWGLVTNEAMHYGLPIITTNAAASAEHLIDGNGLIVPPKDSHAIMNAITLLLNNDHIRGQMAERSKEIINQENDIESGANTFVDAVNSTMCNDK